MRKLSSPACPPISTAIDPSMARESGASRVRSWSVPCPSAAHAPYGPDDDQYATADVRATWTSSGAVRGRADIVPYRVRIGRFDRGSQTIVQRGLGNDRCGHPFSLQARARSGRCRRRCLRIKPGHIGSADRRARGVKRQGEAARSGSGSMQAVSNASCSKNMVSRVGGARRKRARPYRILEDHDFREYKVAVKASDVFLAVAASTSSPTRRDCPIHLGITEAGGFARHLKSAIGSGSLLWAGIGDTIRVSLSAEPEEKSGSVSKFSKGWGSAIAAFGCLVPELRSPGVRRHRNGRKARGAAVSHPNPDVRCRCAGCGRQAPARRARRTSDTGGGKGKIWCTCPGCRHSRSRRGHGRSHRPAGRSEGRSDRGRSIEAAQRRFSTPPNEATNGDRFGCRHGGHSLFSGIWTD